MISSVVSSEILLEYILLISFSSHILISKYTIIFLNTGEWLEGKNVAYCKDVFVNAS